MPRSLTIPISGESEPDPVADAHEAVGEFDTDEFDYPIEICDKSHNGQCEYSGLSHHTICIHCGRNSASD